MVLNFWNSSSKTPQDVNDTMGAAAYDFQWSTAKSKYGLQLAQEGSSTAHTTTSKGTSFAIEQLKLGRPVIIGMTSPTTTHFVVATAYYNNEIYIKDPAGRNYTKLSQYTNTSYSIYEVFAYYK
ncbi:MAG: C39 family peptidase [Ruminococcus flavefaciens]|nr:C39 family peptidase [Ruminococcus flavefaciens]MCM1059279.1 C39 family peptidase [Eubacterium sp.]